MTPITFDRQVAIITGGGRGLGRTYALELARRGARVVVNDLGGQPDGQGGETSAADQTVAEVVAAGGEAVASYDSVATPDGGAAIVQTALDAFGTVDIVINNAGILRDRSFANLDMADLRAVVDVHLLGAFHVTQPAFRVMKEKGYGRLLFTTSSAGIWGNFGQSNYGAAKMGLVGLSNVLALEGAKYGITSNVVAPIAASRLTEGLLGDLVGSVDPEVVTPLSLYLVSPGCEVTHEVYSAGGGRFARVFVSLTEGWMAGKGAVPSLEDVRDHLAEIRSEVGYTVPLSVQDESEGLMKKLRVPEVAGSGIISYGVYLPSYRLDRAAIGTTLGGPTQRGTRTVASFDEDTTSMGVEAGRAALRDVEAPAQVIFATTDPAYLDKTNATAIHAALALPSQAAAYDMVGSVRSGIGALRAAADAAAAGRPSLAVLSDVRTGLPGGADEASGGDGAAAFAFGSGAVVAEVIGLGCATVEVLERWRSPGDSASRAWEERFGETVYAPLVAPAVADACKQAGITTEAVSRAVVTGLHSRAIRRISAELAAGGLEVQDALLDRIGNTGCAHPGILLADALDRAAAGEVILLVALADGVEVMLLRATDELAQRRSAQVSVASQVERSALPVDYPTFLTWRGMLDREPPRRPEPQAPAAPPSFRTDDWKFGFVGSRCIACGSRHLPPVRTCFSCRAVDDMVPEAMSDVPARIATFTVDHLAYSVSPPTVVAVVDFEGGGRFQCEMTDVIADAVAIGDPVEMTFRRLTTVAGVHNYFWKTRPLRTAVGEEH